MGPESYLDDFLALSYIDDITFLPYFLGLLLTDQTSSGNEDSPGPSRIRPIQNQI